MQTSILNLLPDPIRQRVINEAREELQKAGTMKPVEEITSDAIKNDILAWAESHKKSINKQKV